MIERASSINPFHEALAAEIAKILGYATTIKPEPPEWQDLADKRKANFHLFAQPRGLTLFPDRNERRRCPVLPLYRDRAEGLEATIWVGWEEEWISAGDGKFELVGGAWTFLWGYQTSPKQLQLFRANWDNTQRRGGEAAQPHWHFDKELVSELYRKSADTDVGDYEEQANPEQVEGEDLIELRGAVLLQPLSMAGIHLGMGGWTNPGTGYKCWQQVPDTLANLRQWAASALGHAKAQFDHLKSGDAVAL